MVSSIPMLLVLTAAAFVALGYEWSWRLWREAGPFERTTYASALGIALWIASIWMLSFAHLLTQPMVIGRTAVAAVVAYWLWQGRWAARPPATGVPPIAVIILCAVPVALWLLFILYRGAVLPPVSHDALAYHLPKAILFARAHSYEFLADLNPRIRNIPANYELLLADTIVASGKDAVTEWISSLFWILFAVASAALAERWWRLPSSAVVAGLFAAGIPVALLHSGAHKNDLMVAFFIVAALVGAGRWIARRDAASLVVAIVAFAAAIGTKPQAAAVALCVAPFVLWKMPLRQIFVFGLLAVVAIFLLGGAVYVYNFRHEHEVIGVGDVREASTVIAYGDWRNLWQAPYVLLAAPFAKNPRELPVPWEGHPWFWRRYEVFFSHLGVLFPVCTLLAIVMMFLQRFDAERRAITIAAAGAFVLLLPVVFTPHGMFAISLPRYALFLVPVVFAWAVGSMERLALPLAAIGAAVFCWYAVDNAKNDTFAPIEYVRWIRQHHGNRSIPFDPYRAASVADRRAGPRETIALDAAFGAWIYPAFGADLRRPVRFIQGDRIPDDARWIAIDRGYASIWEHPDFKDLSQARQFLVRGIPKPEDLRLLNALRADRRFESVFYNPKTNQAVFRRIQ